MPVEKKTRFNLTYLLVALWGVLLIQGGGAARVRELFTQAREKDPCIIPREYSERTAAQVDDEVKALHEEREARVRGLVEARREALEKVARRLLEVEVLYTEEFERLAGCGAVPGPVGEAA